MGRVVTFAELQGSSTGDGVTAAPITASETKEFTAELIRIAPGKQWSARAPKGSDCYLFALTPGAAISSGNGRVPLPAQSFATVQEGESFAIGNDAAAAVEIVKVIAPPQARGDLPGFTGKLKVAERASTPVVPVPEERKQRIYFVGGHGAKSERGHAMIVVYDGQTHTPLHHHPNADSLFVLLDGAVEFIVNGEKVVVTPGQAACFPAKDRHGLHTAPGHAGASFLEFHIPAAFTTVKE